MALLPSAWSMLAAVQFFGERLIVVVKPCVKVT